MKTITQLAKLMMRGVVLFALLNFMVSCNKELTADSAATEIKSAEGFNYENKVDMNLSLAFKDDKANPNPNLPISIYFENPISETGLSNELTPVIKGATNASGVFAIVVTVPAHLSKIYAVVGDYMSYNECIEIPKSTAFSSTIYPRGFGLLKSSVVTKGAFDPVLYTRQTTAFNASYPAIAGNEPELFVLGSYNASTGAPNYLTNPIAIPSGLLARLSAALPSTKNQTVLNSITHYFDNPMKANVVLEEPANVWVTYLSEGAWICNTVGYFYYPTNTPPSTVGEINKRIIFFPNASENGNGTGGSGGMAVGNTVSLKYYNSVSGTWTPDFPSGYTIGWFLVTSGWGGSNDGLFANVHKWQYSLPSLNSGSLPQTIVLGDVTSTSLTLTFEDGNIGEGDNSAGRSASDRDYNDVCFMVKWNPITAIHIDDYPAIDDDDDGDGVVNASDEYPTDPLRAYNNYYPSSTGFGTLAFEDNWPEEGDYDFNDMVVDYRIKYVKNAAGNVKDVEFTAKLRAIGASNRNGFAWEFDGDPSNVSSVTTTYTGPGTLLGGSLFPLTSSGCESGTSKIVIPFFDNAFTLFGASYIADYPNTVIGGPTYSPVTVVKKVTLNTPVTVASLSSLPYNPFMVASQNRGREIHKAGFRGTSKANVAYYNTLADRTNQNNKWYVGTANLPWVLDVPSTFKYPVAGKNIKSGYLRMQEWGSSSGSSFTDWYSNTAAGYRDNTKLK